MAHMTMIPLWCRMWACRLVLLLEQRRLDCGSSHEGFHLSSILFGNTIVPEIE